MGSGVVFDNLYLDRCLRSSWCLEVIMLLLLGDTILRISFVPTMFGLPGSWVCRWMIWCHLIFLIYPFWCHTGAYFRSGWDFPIFTELHVYPHLRGIRWDDDVFIVSWWSLSGAPVEPFIQVRISRHRFVFMLFILRDVPWMFGFDLDHGNHMSYDKWLHTAQFPTYSYIWCHTGAYFHFGWGSEISMELHDHSHSRSTRRDDDLFTIFKMIPQWSLSGAIQLGTHFSTLKCYHVSFREIHFGSVSMILLWIQVTRFTYMLMDDLMSFDLFRLVTHLMPY